MTKQFCSKCRAEPPQGPFTNDEWLKLHGVEPASAKDPEYRTDGLRALQVEVEARQQEYDECLHTFAILDAKISRTPGGHAEMQRPGMSLHKKAVDEAAAAWRQVEIAGETLQAARVAFHKMAKKLETEYQLNEYQRGLAEQEEARQAKAAARRQNILDKAKNDTLLGGLAKRLVGA